MMYPITVNSTYIQTDTIMSMVVSGGPTYTVTMNDAAVTTFTVTAAQFFDIINQVNTNRA